MMKHGFTIIAGMGWIALLAGLYVALRDGVSWQAVRFFAYGSVCGLAVVAAGVRAGGWRVLLPWRS